ncbi:MAG: YfiT family bacillithiol transferase [Chitinophagaceae bacterium]
MQEDLEKLRYPIGKFESPISFNPDEVSTWINTLNALPSWLDVIVENLDAHQLETPYRPGGWTMIQTIQHLADSHMNAFVRFKLALTEDNPTVKPYEEARWAETPEIFSVPVNVSITLLHALHRRWTALLEAFSENDWQRTYYHPEQKKDIPLWSVAAMYAWHSRHHMEQLRELKERMNW